MNCAHKPNVSPTQPLQPQQITQTATTPNAADSVSLTSSVAVGLLHDPNSEVEIGLPEKEFAEHFSEHIDKLKIELSFAHLEIKGKNKEKKNKIKTSLVKGSKEDCKIAIIKTLNQIVIQEPLQKERKKDESFFPKNFQCEFKIEISFINAAELELDINKSNITIENWEKPIFLKAAWGEMDFSQVQDLTLDCGNCTLTGENISGDLKYTLKTGNVGVEGLTGTVQGETSGDTILKWKKLKPNSNVKIISRVGDVVLTFPKKIALFMDLKVKNGEIYSKLNSDEDGIPVTVVLQAGNLKIYRSTTH